MAVSFPLRPITGPLLDSQCMAPCEGPEAASISHGRIGLHIDNDGRSSLPAR